MLKGVDKIANRYYNVLQKGVKPMAVSLRLSKEDEALIRSYAALKKISVSEMIRQAVMEKIEDEYDLKAYEQAMAAYKADPVTYSMDEVGEILGLV